LYKIILDNKVIDVIKKPRFLKFLSSGNIALTDKTSANGIVGSDNKTIYSLVTGLKTEAPVVSIHEIDQKEFNRLSSLLNSGAELIANKTKLQNAIKTALENLSQICKDKITAGFSVLLSDGNVYKFKLSAEDQINLLNLENQLNTGENIFVYHATDMPCQVFRREDMQKVIKSYRKHILYHTTYFNIAKQYISSLTDIAKIDAFHYGTNVIGVVSDPAIRQILRDGEVH
jgi:hypothetical protein